MRVSLRVIPGIENRESNRENSESNREKAGVEPGKSRNRTGINRLTDAACRAFKPADKAYKKSDGKGLYLLVKPNGAKLWQFAYDHQGKPNVYSIGAFDEVSLAEARIERDRARGWLKAGLDPNIEKKAERLRVAARQGDDFRKLAEDWLAKQSVNWSKDHADARRRLLDRDLYPPLGGVPLTDLEDSPATALAALQRIESRGAHEIASKARIVGSMICRYGIVTGRMKHDPFAHLGDALARPPVEHRATIPLAEMPTLFDALGKVPAEANTKLALYWLILTCVRTSEMRFATWSEVDSKARLWRIPAARMKMRDPHVVSLSTQAQRVLDLAKPLRTSDDPGALIFPGFTRHGALSENALLALLARAGFFGRQTGHGFRASFSTWAHEVVEADPDVVEACLAHTRGDVRSIYNRATYLSKRRELLQAWADQCEAWGMKLP
jgi:integrase